MPLAVVHRHQCTAPAGYLHSRSFYAPPSVPPASGAPPARGSLVLPCCCVAILRFPFRTVSPSTPLSSVKHSRTTAALRTANRLRPRPCGPYPLSPCQCARLCRRVGVGFDASCGLVLLVRLCRRSDDVFAVDIFRYLPSRFALRGKSVMVARLASRGHEARTKQARGSSCVCVCSVAPRSCRARVSGCGSRPGVCCVARLFSIVGVLVSVRCRCVLARR
ncbi:hypothetical protein BKA62DRAFT_86770 [Auriculariales sp. MPI-PUGE-AT-0066]|nr:hypothetical protein BKA62DRAFT_86770 [Auriculariales sp. MPI-PUGE-AT-0066]